MPLTRNVNPLKSINSKEGIGSIAAVNICLISLIVVASLYFVVATNAITSGQLKVSSLNSELSQINQENSDLLASKIEAEDSNSILVYAQNNNMIEAKTVAHIFESGDVALRR